MPVITGRLRQQLGRAKRRVHALTAPPPPPVDPAPPTPAEPEVHTEVLDGYVHTAPSPENAINIFHGEWSSKLPAPYEEITGPSGLFADPRIEWMIGQLGGVDGFDVLELGPLEAAHTTMVERAGAKSVLAIEANTRAYLKCLVVKETFGLRNSSFLCGDMIEFLTANEKRFDLCLASGVLYHLREPEKALQLMSRSSDRLLLWTHYYDEAVMAARPEIAAKFGEATTVTIDGLDVVRHYYNYGLALNWNGFSGGSAEYSNWLSKEDILACLRHFGYTSIEINDDTGEHPNGPCFTVLAQRSA